MGSVVDWHLHPDSSDGESESSAGSSSEGCASVVSDTQSHDGTAAAAAAAAAAGTVTVDDSAITISDDEADSTTVTPINTVNVAAEYASLIAEATSATSMGAKRPLEVIVLSDSD